MLVAAAQLKSMIEQGQCVVYDCRFRLGQPDAGREAYHAGHIPTAYFLDLERDLSAPVSTHGGRHPLPNPQELAAKLGATGLTDGVTAVVYDAGEGMATHAWWLIRYLGHDNVHVLNGGITAWVHAGFLLSSEEPKPSGAVFTPHVRSEWVVDAEIVQDVVSGAKQATLLDARAPERYRGDVEPIDPIGGHIPTAHNVPWTEGVDAQGRWLPGDAQRDRFQHFVEQGKPLIAYCGSGVTACANLFAMELAGIQGAKLYAGSWSDWVSYPDAPVAKGGGRE